MGELTKIEKHRLVDNLFNVYMHSKIDADDTAELNDEYPDIEQVVNKNVALFKELRDYTQAKINKGKQDKIFDFLTTLKEVLESGNNVQKNVVNEVLLRPKFKLLQPIVGKLISVPQHELREVIKDVEILELFLELEEQYQSKKAEKKWTHLSVLRLMAVSGNSNPVEEIRSRARDLVIEGLERGWQGPPFNAVELAKVLGIPVVPNDSVLDARILPIQEEGYLIEYNPYQKPTRMNFSVAHEIAHTFFPDCREKIRNREETPIFERELEQLCNIGASEIQLPWAVFSSDANNIDSITIDNLVALATKYKSSLESLFIRFVEVVDKSCAILICSFKRIDQLTVEYNKTSRLFEEIIPANFVIPAESKAYECTAPGWTTRETVNWPIFEGSYNIYCIGLSPMRKDNTGRVGIVISPKDEEEENLQDRKIILEYGDATKPQGKGIKIIGQVVNSSGGLGVGFGKSLVKNFPEIKDSVQQWKANRSEFVLGKTNLVHVGKDLYVLQMLAQKGLFAKNGEIPLKYSSLRECLIDLCMHAKKLNASVHMPAIGAGQAKGDWNVILGIIHDELISKGVKVKIYFLPTRVPNVSIKASLAQFNESSTWHKEE